MKAELGVHLIQEYVKNMQFVPSKLGVCLIHKCILYTRQYSIVLILKMAAEASAPSSRGGVWCYDA